MLVKPGVCEVHILSSPEHEHISTFIYDRGIVGLQTYSLAKPDLKTPVHLVQSEGNKRAPATPRLSHGK